MKFFIFVTVAFLASFIVQEFIPAFEWAYLSRLLLVHITFLAIAAAVPFPAMLLYALIGGFIWDARHHIPIYPPEATAEIFIQAELPFGFTIFIFGLTGALIQGVRPLFCKGPMGAARSYDRDLHLPGAAPRIPCDQLSSRRTRDTG